MRSPTTLSRTEKQPIEIWPVITQNCCVHRAALALDEIDLSLLELLQQDARRSLRELGEVIGLSPSAVHRRIARYYSTGVIARQVALLDSRLIGGPQLAIVLVTLETESTHDHSVLRERLLTTPEVQQSYDVAGEWDYVVILTARDIGRLPRARRAALPPRAEGQKPGHPSRLRPSQARAQHTHPPLGRELTSATTSLPECSARPETISSEHLIRPSARRHLSQMTPLLPQPVRGHPPTKRRCDYIVWLIRLRMLPSGSLNQTPLKSPMMCTSPSRVVSGRSS